MVIEYSRISRILNGMITEAYNGYVLEAAPYQTDNGKRGMAVKIRKTGETAESAKSFHAYDRIWYLLEIEAAKESINLGKNPINRNLTGL